MRAIKEAMILGLDGKGSAYNRKSVDMAMVEELGAAAFRGALGWVELGWADRGWHLWFSSCDKTGGSSF